MAKEMTLFQIFLAVNSPKSRTCSDHVKPARRKLTFACFTIISQKKPTAVQSCRVSAACFTPPPVVSLSFKTKMKTWVTQVCGAALCKMFIRLVVILQSDKRNSFVLAAARQCLPLHFDSLWKSEETLRWESMSAGRGRERAEAEL